MDWTVILCGLLGGVLVGSVVSIALAHWQASRRRCRECGRARVLRRVPGTRRHGFVRFRCKRCGNKQWGVIVPNDVRLGMP